MQTKLQSWIEVGLNTGIAMAISMLAQMVVFPAYGIHVSHSANFQILCWFTVISLVRSYMVRRFFNWWHK